MFYVHVQYLSYKILRKINLNALTDKSQWNGVNDDNLEIDVGSLTHWMACQLVTIHTSGMLTMLSKNWMKPSLWWGCVNQAAW